MYINNHAYTSSRQHVSVVDSLPGHGLECFLCSYSPRGNSSRMDGCTDANFTEDLTETRTCAIGCESVAVYDLNGKLLTAIVFLRVVLTAVCVWYRCRIFSNAVGNRLIAYH